MSTIGLHGFWVIQSGLHWQSNNLWDLRGVYRTPLKSKYLLGPQTLSKQVCSYVVLPFL